MAKDKGFILVVLIILFLFFYGKNLHAVVPYQPTLTKVDGSSVLPNYVCNGPADPFEGTVTIPGVVTLSNFWKTPIWQQVTGCQSNALNDAGCDCSPGAQIISQSSTTDSFGCTKTTYVYNCYHQTSCLNPPRNCCNGGYDQKTSTPQGGPVVIQQNNICNEGMTITLPNGTSYVWSTKAGNSIANGQNYNSSSSGPFNSPTVSITNSEECTAPGTCAEVSYSIIPKQFALNIVYTQAPTSVIQGTPTTITAYVWSNITQSVTARLNGHWSYPTPWGTNTQSYSTSFVTLNPNTNTTIPISVPTNYLFSLTFSFDTADVQYSVPNLNGGSGSINLALPSNSVTIIPKPSICYQTSDCPTVLCANGVPDSVYCSSSNLCIYSNCPPSTPMGTWNWNYLSSIWSSFWTWVKSLLNW